MQRRWKQLAVLALIIAGAVLGRGFLAERFNLEALIAEMRAWGGGAAAIPIYFGVFGVVTSLFMPAVAMMITAGVTWGFWPGWVLVWAAANVWAHVHFAIGRWLGGDSLRRWLEGKGVTWLIRELDQGGIATTIMVRQLPLPYPLVNLTAGASPIRWSRWTIGNAIGLIPNCLIYTQLAAALAEGAEGAKERAAFRVVLAAAGVIGIGLLSRLVQRRFAAQRESVTP